MTSHPTGNNIPLQNITQSSSMSAAHSPILSPPVTSSNSVQTPITSSQAAPTQLIISRSAGPGESTNEEAGVVPPIASTTSPPSTANSPSSNAQTPSSRPVNTGPSNALGTTQTSSATVAQSQAPTSQAAVPATTGHRKGSFSKTRNFVSNIGHALFALAAPFLATAVFVTVAYMAYTVNVTRGPLINLSPAKGTLVLNLLSKATDYSLLAASGVAFERIHWSRMLQGGEKMLSYFVMTSGLAAWFKVLLLKHKQREVSQVHTAARNLSLIRKMGNWAAQPRTLSLMRITIWILLQFPGIILMAIVNPQTTYQGIKYTPIGGGIGIYNTSLVTNSLNVQGTTNLILNLNSDAKVSTPSTPEHSDCKQAGPNCTSILIPGGLQLVTPWPSRTQNDSSLIAYITKNAPAYQMDAWPGPIARNWSSNECGLYGLDDSSVFQLCMTSEDQNSGILFVGWRPCPGNVLPDGECSYNGSWDAIRMISRTLVFYRRPATIAGLRSNSQILSVLSLGTATQQIIPPADFNVSFQSLLYPYVGNQPPQTCSRFSTAALLTTTLWIDLYFGLDAAAYTSTGDILTNLFSASLYLFNPMMINTQEPSILTIQPGLPDENKVTGSYARQRTYVAPQAWTVYAYLGSAGALLFLVSVAFLGTAGSDMPKLSAFAPLMYSKVSWNGGHINNGGQAQAVSASLSGDIREDLAKDGIGDRGVMKKAANMRVVLRSEEAQGHPVNGNPV